MTRKKELQGLEEGSEADIYLDFQRATLKKVLNLKTLGYDSIYGFRFTKSTSINERLGLQLSNCIEKATIAE